MTEDAPWENPPNFSNLNPWGQERPVPLVPVLWDNSRIPLWFKDHRWKKSKLMRLYEKTPESETNPGLKLCYNDKWLHKVTEYMVAINEEIWNVVVTGMYESLNFNTYVPERRLYSEGEHTDYNEDDRSKLSLVYLIQQADVGGDLIVSGMNTRFAEGDIVVFPGWVRHHVTPIEKGTRISMTAWLAGPAWR